MAALDVRANAEANPGHARAQEVCDRTLPWLERVGAGPEAEPLELEILRAPLGTLGPDQRADASWAGEGAAILAWAIQRREAPPPAGYAGPGETHAGLLVFRNEAHRVIDEAALRPEAELRDLHKSVLIVLTWVRERRARDPQVISILRRVRDGWLAAVGLKPEQIDLRDGAVTAAAAVSALGEHASALYFVRKVCTSWLMEGRPSYFEADSPQ